MDWTEEPATQQQLLRLKELRFAATHPLTVTEAARLIRQYSKHPLRPAAPPSPQRPRTAGQQPGVGARRLDLAASQHEFSESTRMHAYRLRVAVETAKLALAATPNGPNVRADSYSSAAARREFWLDTCRDVKEMQIGSVQVFEFHQNFGVCFFAPTGEQVQEVLDALDQAMPTWDRDHPELFYQTLELNFPNLVRLGTGT